MYKPKSFYALKFFPSLSLLINNNINNVALTEEEDISWEEKVSFIFSFKVIFKLNLFKCERT